MEKEESEGRMMPATKKIPDLETVFFRLQSPVLTQPRHGPIPREGPANIVYTGQGTGSEVINRASYNLTLTDEVHSACRCVSSAYLL